MSHIIFGANIYEFVACDFQGEVCVATSRVYVHEGIYDEFEKKLVEKAKAWVVGDPFDPKSQQGPQVRIIYIAGRFFVH